MKKGFRILSYVLLPLFAGAFIAGDIVAYKNHGVITAVLSGNTTDFEGEDVDRATKMGDALCQEIEEEGIVLLKNSKLEDDTYSLPLDSSATKVNVFGWASTQFLQKGVGSGSSSINPDRSINLLQALDNYGISYNKNITSEYTRFSVTNVLEKNNASGNDYKLFLPTKAWHERLLDNAKAFSDTAILVLHRVGGENLKGEIPTSQILVTENGEESVTNRTYLQTSKYEDDLIDLLANNFKNVILMLNTTNPMHLTCLNSNKIKSCISVGITGQSGANAIPNILWGKKKVNNESVLVSPSGKLTDIYSYEPDSSPSFINHVHSNNHIQYVEDIYYGYKWYETADVEGFWDGTHNSYGDGYDAVVQFPFGFGMSYTNFSWSNMVTTISPEGNLTKDSKVNVKVTVKNTGTYPGKDVVELYVSPSYKKGEIEKPAVQLVDFAKTGVLNPNDEETVELNFDLYDIASYDCYDKNNNGFSGYELDYAKDGKYEIRLMTDSHHLKDVDGGNAYTLNIPEEGIKFINDNVTNHTVGNLMTGSSAYAGVPIDGSTVGAETVYLSRNDFANTLPTSHAKTPTSEGGDGKGPQYYCDAYKTDAMPNTNPVDSGLRIVTLEDGSFANLEQLSGKTEASLKANTDLIAELSNYDSDTWDALLNQMSITDICDLVENGGFHTYPIDSIGKPRAFDTDGPAGFNLNTLSIGDGDASKWTAYPSETVIAQTWNKELAEKMGLCMGMEAQATKVQGWYAPGVNLHRSPYTARNYEYYSEDAVLSGIFAAQVIKGAKTNGLYCYLKHFVLSEPGPNPRKMNTWCTEQNLRENYLKPFEIAVKKGEANAIMSAFNRVGSVWAGANYACLVQILRDEWGFNGSVITDYAMTNEPGNMNPEQGVRAGNDLWLNPSDGTINSPLDRNNPTVVNAARHAAKNIIFTYVDTYYYGSMHEAIYPEYNAEVSISVTAAGNAWWIPVLIIIESIVILGLLTYVGFAVTSAVKIYMAKPHEKIKREPKPLYITKRMKKIVMIFMVTGLVGAISCVVLIPLFNDILADHTLEKTIVPIDDKDLFANKFEFEDGTIEGVSIGEDHLCSAKSYFYNMDLSNNASLANLNGGSKVTFDFVASNSYRVTMNIRMASIYDEENHKWIESNLNEYIALKANGVDVDLNSIKIPASSIDEKIDNYTGNDMNMVNVVGIPVTLSNISNLFEFTILDNCPAIDYFAIYTSADIDDFESSGQLNAANETKVLAVPSAMKKGRIEIGCEQEGCDKKSNYDIPLLTGKKWYSYDSENNSYGFSIFDRKYIITPDTTDKIIGPIHSECKVVNNFKGDNFFQGSNWNHQSSKSQKAADYVYSLADIIDGEGNVVLTDSTPGKTNVFYCDNRDRKPLVDYGTAANKDYLGKKIEYSFLVNSTGGFTLTAFGMIYSDANLKAKISVPGIFFDFMEDGKVGLTIGTDSGSPSSEAKKVFRTPINFITADSHMEFNKDLWIKMEFTRKTPEEFEFALFVNDEKVMFPTMSDSTTGNIANRYTEDGNLYIIQDETYSHSWGEYIAVAPNNEKTFIFKDLNYKVGA